MEKHTRNQRTRRLAAVVALAAASLGVAVVSGRSVGAATDGPIVGCPEPTVIANVDCELGVATAFSSHTAVHPDLTRYGCAGPPLDRAPWCEAE